MMISAAAAAARNRRNVYPPSVTDVSAPIRGGKVAARDTAHAQTCFTLKSAASRFDDERGRTRQSALFAALPRFDVAGGCAQQWHRAPRRRDGSRNAREMPR